MARPKRLGEYDVLLTLATGGMGEVKLARRSGPAGFQKLFAIKVLHPHLASEPTLVESFRREAMLAARVHHPNVVHTFELGQADPPESPEPDDPPGPTFFLVMEHVEGESLGAVLRAYAERGEIPPWPVMTRIVRDAAAGLQAAHDAKSDDGAPLGIVHRDVSPPNILVGTNGVARVVDFGIAKAFAEAASVATGKLRGKLSYMSPEQVRGDPLDGRSDVFSLGAVLYESVCGIRPFRAEHEMETVKNVLEREPPPISQLVSNVPPVLEAAISSALAKDRDKRCASARDLARMLDECLRVTPQPVTDEDVGAELMRLLGTRITERRSRVRQALRALGTQDTTPSSGSMRPPPSPPSGSTELLRPETPVVVESPTPAEALPPPGPHIGWRTVVSACLLVAAGAGGALLAVRSSDDARNTTTRPPASTETPEAPRSDDRLRASVPAIAPSVPPTPTATTTATPTGSVAPAITPPSIATTSDAGTSAALDAASSTRPPSPPTPRPTTTRTPTPSRPPSNVTRPATPARPTTPTRPTKRGLRRDDITF